jgi:dynein heavy chain
LSQQLSHPSVQHIKERLDHFSQTENGLGNGVVDEFVKNLKHLNKFTAEAKENVKFLTTLERQFKNLASEEGFHVIL